MNLTPQGGEKLTADHDIRLPYRYGSRMPWIFHARVKPRNNSTKRYASSYRHVPFTWQWGSASSGLVSSSFSGSESPLEWQRGHATVNTRLLAEVISVSFAVFDERSAILRPLLSNYQGFHPAPLRVNESLVLGPTGSLQSYGT